MTKHEENNKLAKKFKTFSHLCIFLIQNSDLHLSYSYN